MVSPPPPAGTIGSLSTLWTSACALLGSLGATILGPLIIKWYGTHLVRVRDRELRAPEYDYRKEELKAASEVREMMVDDYRDMRERVRSTEAELARLRAELARLLPFEARTKELEEEVSDLREREDRVRELEERYRRGAGTV